MHCIKLNSLNTLEFFLCLVIILLYLYIFTNFLKFFEELFSSMLSEHSQLQTENDHLFTILNNKNLDEGIISVDENKQIYFQNQQFREIFNDDMLKNIELCMNKSHKFTTAQSLITHLIKELPISPQKDIDIAITNSQEQTQSLKAVLVNNPHTKGFSVIFKSTKTLETIRKLRRKDEQRQIMVGSLTHELRTPINGLMIILGLLKRNEQIPGNIVEKFIQPSLNITEYQLSIVNDILDFTRDSFGREIRMTYKPCNIRKIIHSTFNMLQLPNLQRRQKINFITDIDEKIPTAFNTDKKRLKSILINLIGNAIKFTQEGYIKVVGKYLPEQRTGVSKLPSNQGVIKLTVIDTGVGIEEKNLGKIFNLFSTFSSSKVSNSSGMGFGLYQSNKLAKHLGPDNKGISVNSVLAKGSEFSFCIENKTPTSPTQHAPAKEEDDGHQIPYVSTYHSMRLKLERNSLCFNDYKHQGCPQVLIVDDSVFNTYVLSLLLQELRCNSDQANNGQEAIELLRKSQQRPKPYKLILLDCYMPRMDGYAVCQKIQQLIKGRTIKPCTIIAFTGDTTEGNIKRCKSVGFDDVVNKSIQRGDLSTLLCKYQLLN